MSKYRLPIWKEAPFIRIIIPFISGIVLGAYTGIQEKYWLAFVLVCFIVLLLQASAGLSHKFRFRYYFGFATNVLIVATGGFITELKNPFVNEDVIASQQGIYVVSLEEPPSEKKSSWKALSSIECIRDGNKDFYPETYLLIYFRKDSNLILPQYGSRIAFKKKTQKIQNFTPGSSFDYQRYCALKNIHYQVFLHTTEIIHLPGNSGNFLDNLLFTIQRWVVSVLQKNIAGKKEYGLAEALLIGYKNDLDKNLIQSYSNTGVVHVVAISGLHLGLIYFILNIIFGRVKGKVLKAVIIISGLWLFSLLAGGGPSVLRSALMFSIIVIGESFSKKSTVLNNLAVSAFLLLCFDPYWLWDLGFILSYSALLSIVMFMKPIYNVYISENRLLDAVWKVNAVTISAQILTLPVLLYYFHQFPNLFIITNFVAIPLSSIILIGEILLCVVSFIEPVAMFCGNLLTIAIKLMNGIVEYIDKLPFSSTKNIDINLIQVVLLYVFIALAADFVMIKHKSWQ